MASVKEQEGELSHQVDEGQTQIQPIGEQQIQNLKEQDEEFKINRSNQDNVIQQIQKQQINILNQKIQKEEEDLNNVKKSLENGPKIEDVYDNYNNQNEDEQEQVGELDKYIPECEKSLEKALEFKDKGNKFFYEQLFDDAIEYYDQAVNYCPITETKQLSVLCSNLAICYLRKNDYETVIQYSTDSIKFDPTFKKPYLNRITAYEKTEKLEEAIEDLKELEKLDPNDKTLKAKIFVMEKDLAKLNETRKTEVLSGLKDLGNSILGKFGLSLDNFKLNQNQNGSYNINFSK